MNPKARGKLILLVLTLLPGALQAQVDTVWVRRYNGPGNRADYFNGLAVDGSGNTFATGASWVSGNGLDFITIRYTPSGDTAWVRTFNGAGDSTDVGYRIALDQTGGVHVLGASIGNNSKQDYLILKYDTLGTLLWSRTYNGPSSEADVPNALALDSVGDAFVTGRSHGGSTGYDYLTIKYRPNGDTAWVRRYNGMGSGYDEAFAVGVDGIGNVYVSGRSYTDSTRADFLTVKYSPSGDTLWTRRWDGSLGDDIPDALGVDASGNVNITGTSRGANGNDVLTLSYGPGGNVRWNQRYDGPSGGTDEGRDLAVDRWGNVAVAGTDSSTSVDALVLKYDSLGALCWVRTYNGSGNSSDAAQDLCSDPLGHFYIAGRSVGLGTQDDFFATEYDSAGNRIWVQRYDGQQGYDEALDIGLDRAGNVYVTGQSWGGATSWDGATIKYRPVTGVEKETDLTSTRSLALKVYGPSQDGFRLQYSLPTSGNVRIEIFDVRGARVRELLSGYRPAGEHYEMKSLSLTAGIYFLRLSASGQECFGKTIFLR